MLVKGLAQEPKSGALRYMDSDVYNLPAISAEPHPPNHRWSRPTYSRLGGF